MIRYLLAFFLGSLCPATAIYLLGGSHLSIFLFGASTVLLLLLLVIGLWPKQLAKLLWAYAHTWEDGKSQFEKTVERNYRTAGRELTRKPPQPTPMQQVEEPARAGDAATILENDVVSALVNLGLRQKQARNVVEQVASHQQYESFEELFHDCMGVAGRIKSHA